MVKILLFAFVFHIYASAQEITLAESFLEEYVAKKAGAPEISIRKIIIQPTSKLKSQVILVYSSALCGNGLCESYAFIKNKNSSFDFAGVIQGTFVESKDVEASSVPNLQTEISVAGSQSSTTSWVYSPVRKKYEAQ